MHIPAIFNHSMLKLHYAWHAEKLQADPSVKCLVLKDEADPGFPSFLVLATSHLSIFGGKLLPTVLLNQGGDPFLMELYRCIGVVDSMPSVTVRNKQGILRSDTQISFMCNQTARAEQIAPTLSNVNCPYTGQVPDVSLQLTAHGVTQQCKQKSL